nr:aldo/keto reductase [Rhodobacter xinxiangensis]
MATLAEAHGLPRPIGLQYSWSLIERGVELDLVPMAQALGLGVVPWSPLAAGMLTGKYGREMLTHADRAVSLPDKAASAARSGDGRLSGDNPYGGMLFTERNFAIVDTLHEVAAEIGRPMAQVALAWLAAQPAMGSILTGASRPEQLRENVAALEIELSADQKTRLDTVSALPLLNPYFIFDLPRARLFGGQDVRPW